MLEALRTLLATMDGPGVSSGGRLAVVRHPHGQLDVLLVAAEQEIGAALDVADELVLRSVRP